MKHAKDVLDKLEGGMPANPSKEERAYWEPRYNLIATAIKQAEARGLREAAGIANDFDTLTCAQMQDKYKVEIDMLRPELGHNISRYIEAQAQERER